MVDSIKRFNKFDELGKTGLNAVGGWIEEEFLRELRGYRGIRVIKEMSENDAIVGATLFAIEMLMRQVDWRVEPASEDNIDVEAAEFVETCLHDMEQSWHDTLAEIFSMLTYGWSYHEIVYKIRRGHHRNKKFNSRHDDGRIGWRKLPIRSQDSHWRWELDEVGDVAWMEQRAPNDFTIRIIPIEKALHFRTTLRKNNPEGKSILRNAYRSWFYLKNIQNVEAIGIERDLAGLPFARVPSEIMADDADADKKALYSKIKQILRNVRRDEQECIIFPSNMDEDGNRLFEMELLTTGGRRQFDTDKIIRRYEQRIAMTTLADFILLGHEKVGSFALASSKTKLFSTAIGAWLDSISSVFNSKAIPDLMRMNNFPVENPPQLVHGDIESVDLKELGDYISSLTGSGVPLFPNEELEKHLHAIAGLPRPEEGADGVQPVSPPKPPAPEE